MPLNSWRRTASEEKKRPRANVSAIPHLLDKTAATCSDGIITVLGIIAVIPRREQELPRAAVLIVYW
jgi:hypothetical protein